MKKIFFAIGFLLSVYSVYFMLCVADYQLYMNNDHSYDFVLESSTTIGELEKIAKECNLVIQVREYLNIGPGQYEMNIFALNMDKQNWEKPSLLPNNKIHVITELSDHKLQEAASIFMVQTSEETEVENLKMVLEKKGLIIDVERCDDWDPQFRASSMFNENNVKLFFLMFILIAFSSIIYYLTRTKEIGIRKLQGWSDFKIAMLLNCRIAGWSVIGVFPVTILFVVYICIMNITDLFQYLYMMFLLIICLLAVYAIATLGTSLVIRGMKIISAIKLNKNTSTLLVILFSTKIITTILFCWICYSNVNETIDTRDMIACAEKRDELDYYIVETSKIDEAEKDVLSEKLSKIDEQYVYNYSSSFALRSKCDSKNRGRSEDVYSQCEDNVICLSYNLLDKIGVELIDEVDVNARDQYTVLIPEYMFESSNEVLSYLGLGRDTKIVRTKDDQLIADLISPGYYAYNPIVVLTPTVRGLYINSGDIWYDKVVEKDIQDILEETSYGKSKVKVCSLNQEIDAYVKTKCIDLFESIFMGAIVVLAFCITSYALIVAVVQYRKKKIAIYSINGKRAIMAIVGYIVGIVVVDLIVSEVWMWQLGLIILLEILYVSLEFHRLLKNGASRVINGE